MSAASARYMGEIAQMQCVICVRFEATGEASEVHHVAENSGPRSDYATAPLCPSHHRGPMGLHGMGPKAFCRMYRPPGESEYGLLVWTNEDRFRGRKAA
jgi:hypothetical protein